MCIHENHVHGAPQSREKGRKTIVSAGLVHVHVYTPCVLKPGVLPGQVTQFSPLKKANKLKPADHEPLALLAPSLLFHVHVYDDAFP